MYAWRPDGIQGQGLLTMYIPLRGIINAKRCEETCLIINRSDCEILPESDSVLSEDLQVFHVHVGIVRVCEVVDLFVTRLAHGGEETLSGQEICRTVRPCSECLMLEHIRRARPCGSCSTLHCDPRYLVIAVRKSRLPRRFHALSVHQRCSGKDG